MIDRGKMNKSNNTEPHVLKGLAPLLLSFFGVAATILLVPKTTRYLFKRFFWGFIGEIVAVTVSGLIAEKLVHWVSMGSKHLPEPDTKITKQEIS